VPLIIAHPAAKAGATCSALTSHIDLVPTFVGLTGLSESRRPDTVKALPGHDFSTLLTDPEKATLQTVRPGVLFDYVGVSTVDGDYLRNIVVSVFMHSAFQRCHFPLTPSELSRWRDGRFACVKDQVFV